MRLGYVVGPRDLIRELRALRRLMVRHPAAYIQRAFATFLALGHHDALLRRLAFAYKERAEALSVALDAHLPEVRHARITGGSSCWVEGPPWLDATRLAAEAEAHGILIELGSVFFMEGLEQRQCFRMGFSAIKQEKIEPGVRAAGGACSGATSEGVSAWVLRCSEQALAQANRLDWRYRGA